MTKMETAVLAHLRRNEWQGPWLVTEVARSMKKGRKTVQEALINLAKTGEVTDVLYQGGNTGYRFQLTEAQAVA